MSSSETSEATGLRGAAARIAQLTHQGLDVDQFYQQLLDALPVPPGTLGTAAWVKQGNAFQSIARGTRNPPGGIQLPYSNEQHAELLNRVATGGQWEIAAPRRQTDFQTVSENGAPAVAIFPVRQDTDQTFLVEVFLPPDLGDDQLRAFAVRTEMLCAVGSAYHGQPQATSPAPSPATAASVSTDFAREIHRSLNVTETCFAIANEGRSVIGCDRLAVLTTRGRDKYKVRAVSSQDEVNPRANMVQYLQQLVGRTMATGESFWYPHHDGQLPPEIEQALERYVETSLCRTLGILPLFAAAARDLDADAPDPTSRPAPPREPIGALVVERFSDDGSGSRVVHERAAEVALHSGLALGNALDQESVFLLPLWKRLGAVRKFLFGTHRAKTISALVVLALATVALVVLPAELRIASDGRLQPVHRRNVFANLDGTVAQLHVRHADRVAPGDLLAELRSDEIALEIRRLQGEIASNQSRLDALRAQRASIAPDRDRDATATPDNTAIEQKDLEQLIASLHEQLAIQRQRQDLLRVTSPLDGQIVTYDLEELLQDRPVRRGQVLLEVAQLDGPWQLELDVPDRRTMHILRAAQSPGEPLRVSFILASDPQQTYHGTLRQITQATNVDPEIGQFVRMTVAIEAEQIPFRQPGTKIQAKIACGQRSLGYVWFHQVWEFLQSRVLFRIR